MKSLRISNVAGQHNLKGKRTKLLPCGCCVLQNFKWSYRFKEEEKEINGVVKKQHTG